MCLCVYVFVCVVMILSVCMCVCYNSRNAIECFPTQVVSLYFFSRVSNPESFNVMSTDAIHY